MWLLGSGHAGSVPAHWSERIPQLYVKGEFVGGCDIITEMFQSGELETLMAEKGVAHKTEA
jgi:glutaredoxin-related protein